MLHVTSLVNFLILYLLKRDHLKLILETNIGALYLLPLFQGAIGCFYRIFFAYKQHHSESVFSFPLELTTISHFI